MKAKANRTVKLGRPAKLVDGLPAGQLPAFTTRLRPLTRAQLRAIAAEQQRPAYEVLASAIDHLYATLPASQRRRVDQRVQLDGSR
jgi:hypothetical protein